jgi:DNA/RNA endonuclease YhcR with UshA esterase domain
MKALVLVSLLSLAAPAAVAATIGPTDAAAHKGETVTVEGIVSDVFRDPHSGTTFIDMGGTYPDSAFTAVIFSDDAGTFPSVQALSGKTVDITGLVRLHKNKPEIVLKSADQIKAE